MSYLFGTDVNADEVTETNLTENTYNSQNAPFLESSINPDLINASEPSNVIISQDGSFISSEGLLNSEIVFEKSLISDQIIVYTIKDGDTLSGIADYFEISINTIRWENDISGNVISKGQKLRILPITGVKHIVLSGDNVSKIADKYDAETDDILIYNDISQTNPLKKGEVVFIPNGIIKPVVMLQAKKSNTTSKTNSTVSSNRKVDQGYYQRPALGIITSPYGPRKGGFHYGVDIGNVRGTTVVASASGVVTRVVNVCVEGKSSCGGRYGNLVIIQHNNGTKTVYAHLSKVSVSVGQDVSQGQKIATLGNTGSSTGPHLHFEVENANGSKMKPPF